MSATYNFCAGPAMLPQPVMQKAQEELLDWNGQGVSVMEISHRSKEFIALTEQAEADIRDLMNIPSNYHVLFMHGGGRGQFAAVVNNFLGQQGKALYLVDGSWSSAAVEEAKKLAGDAQIDTLNIVEKVNGISRIVVPDLSEIKQDYRYLHYCPNETVDGIEIFEEINSPWPIVADMSSTILSREIDVSKYGVIYAGAQKNIGPAGICIAIVRDDLLGLANDVLPSILNYKLLAEQDSMFNTPPTFAWYLSGLVFKWLKEQGGVKAIEKINRDKAALLYGYIVSSDFYRNEIHSNNRSLMNVPFQLAKPELDGTFLELAEARGLTSLKGHRVVGGMRASIYNAMPLEGVQALVDFMKEFEAQYA